MKFFVLLVMMLTLMSCGGNARLGGVELSGSGQVLGSDASVGSSVGEVSVVGGSCNSTSYRLEKSFGGLFAIDNLGKITIAKANPPAGKYDVPVIVKCDELEVRFVVVITIEETVSLIDGVSDFEHRLFISSSKHGGDMGGRAGADQICQDLAIAEGLQRNYKALIHTSDSSIFSNYVDIGRMYSFDSFGNKVLIANSLNDFINQNILAAPRWDEAGNELVSIDSAGYELWVWTGYNTIDTRTRTCSDWTSLNPPEDGGFVAIPHRAECVNPIDPFDFMAQMQSTKIDCENAGYEWQLALGEYSFEINNGGLTCDGVGGNAVSIYCIMQP